MSYGRKIGDAWVGIHARSAGTEREIERIAQSDADAYAKSFDKTWDDSVKARYARSQRILADALDTGSLKPLIKEHGDLDAALRRSRNELRRLNREGLLSDERMREGLELLTSHGRQYRQNERDSRRFSLAIDSMADQMERLGETDLSRVLASREWKTAISDVDTLDRTTRDYTQTLERLHAEKRITKREMNEYRTVLQGMFTQTLDQIVAEERMEEVRRRQSEILHAHGEALKENDRWERERARLLEKATAEQDSFNRTLRENNEQYDRMRDRDLAAIINGNVDWNKVKRNYGEAGDAFQRLTERMVELEDQSKITSETIDRTATDIHRNLMRVDLGRDDGIEGLTNRLRRLDDRMEVTTRRFEINIGRMFGRGSRNNLLNFIGGLTQAFVAVPGMFLRGFTSIGSGIADVISNFGKLRSAGFGVFGSAMRSLTPLMRSAAGGLVTLGAGFLAIATVLPVLVSGLTMLAGSLVAVAGAIVTGLLGSIMAVLPILGAFAVAAGGIAIAIAAARDNSEGWADSVSGLKDVFEDLKTEAIPTLDRVMELMPRLEEHFRGVGRVGLEAVDGMVDGFERFLDNLDSKEMQQFYTQWGESIPRIIEDVSKGIADLASGLVSWLAPVLPYAEKLAENFANAMENFKEWTASAEGQNSMADWMSVAWEAAEDLWNTLGNIWDVLGSIFTSATEGAGGTFLSWLEDVTGEWASFLETSEGQQAMKDFWRDVEEFMISVKDFLGQIVDIWNDLDTESARDNFNTMLSAIEGILTAVETITPMIENWQQTLQGAKAGSEAGGLWGAFIGGAGSALLAVEDIEQALIRIGAIEDPLAGVIDGWSEKASGFAINLANSIPKSLPIPEQEYVAEAHNAFRRIGKVAALSMNTGVEVGLIEDLGNPFAGYRWLEETKIDGEALGEAMSDSFTSRLRQGLVDIPAQVRPETSRMFTDIENQILENSGIDPVQLEKALRLKEGLEASWLFAKQSFGEGMGEAGAHGADVFGNQFVSGMGGFTTTAGLLMYSAGTGAALALESGVLESMSLLPGAVGSAFEMVEGAARAGARMTGHEAGDMSSAQERINETMPMMNIALGAQMLLAQMTASVGAANISAAGGDLSEMTTIAQTNMAPYVPMVTTVMGLANTVASSGAANIVTSGSNLGQMTPQASAAISGLPSSIGSVMYAAVSTATTRAAEIRNAGSDIGGMVGSARAAISGLGGAIGGVMSAAYATASYWASRIAAAFAAARASADAGVSIGTPPGMAEGGVVYGSQVATIGEAGMEAVVPLNRNLATVHPSVRDLSAFAQGKYESNSNGRSVVVEAGAITLHTATQDPEIVAESLLDRIVAGVAF